MKPVVYFLCVSLFACGTPPEEVRNSSPAPASVAASVPAPPPKKGYSPVCKKFVDGYASVCTKQKDFKLCQDLSFTVEPSATDAQCQEILKVIAPVVKAGLGESPWGDLEGDTKLPQTYSPQSLPAGFGGDGKEFVRKEPPSPLAAPFLAATSQVQLDFLDMKTPKGEAIGFKILFFAFTSDLRFVQENLSKVGLFTVSKDNMLFVLPLIMSVKELESLPVSLAKEIDGIFDKPKGDSPISPKMNDIVKEYDENEISAEAKYTGQYLQAGGEVDRVQRGSDGKAFVMFRTGEFKLFSARCAFPKEKESDLLVLSAGSRAVIRGTVKGKSSRVVEIEDCELIAYMPPKEEKK